MANTLMFEVGIKEADNQLTELEKRLKNIVSTYGKLELKVQVDGLKTFTAALENIGQGKGLEALQRRLDVLQVTLANAGMAGAKSMQEFEAAVKTNSAVADQYRKRIEELTNARNKFVENTEPWRKANDRLTSFREDKNTLAVFAQEQVAIKNLEDAKARLGQANNQEAESFQKVTTSIETLSTAANMLRTTLGSIDSNKGNMAQLIENFEKLHNEIAAVVAELKKIDPSKLNLSGLNLNIGNISGIGDLNSAIHSLEISINNIIGLFSNLTNAIKLQPVDEQVKALLERCETAEAKLREVGDAARYLNERAGAKTQQKANTIVGIAGLEEEQVTKVSSTAERFLRLLVEIEN
jgi:archaellum component FlaC